MKIFDWIRSHWLGHSTAALRLGDHSLASRLLKIKNANTKERTFVILQKLRDLKSRENQGARVTAKIKAATKELETLTSKQIQYHISSRRNEALVAHKLDVTSNGDMTAADLNKVITYQDLLGSNADSLILDSHSMFHALSIHNSAESSNDGIELEQGSAYMPPYEVFILQNNMRLIGIVNGMLSGNSHISSNNLQRRLELLSHISDHVSHARDNYGEVLNGSKELTGSFAHLESELQFIITQLQRLRDNLDANNT